MEKRRTKPMVMLLISYLWTLWSITKKWPRFWRKGSKSNREMEPGLKLHRVLPLWAPVFHIKKFKASPKRAQLHIEVAFAFESQVSFLTDSDCSRAEVGPGFVHGGGSHRAGHMLSCNNMLCGERKCCNCFSKGSWWHQTCKDSMRKTQVSS